jgi:hypothetical protein
MKMRVRRPTQLQVRAGGGGLPRELWGICCTARPADLSGDSMLDDARDDGLTRNILCVYIILSIYL